MAEKSIDWYRVPVDRDVLRKLTTKNDLRGWLQAGSFLLVFLLTAGASLYFFLAKMWVAMVVACYVHSLFHQMVGMAAAVHELSHGTAFRSRRVNEFFYRLFCFLTWQNPVHFRASHMLHHQYTVFRGLDKEVIQEPVRRKMNLLNYVSWATFDWAWFRLLMRANVLHLLGKGNVDFFSWDPLFPTDDPRRKQMIRWARGMFAAWILLTALFAYFHLWVLIYVLVLGNFFATILGRLTGAVQHTGLAESVPDWRLSCYTVRMNPVLRWLYWNMNFHIEHHMYAAVPFWNLPRFHAVIEKDLPEGPRSLSAGLRLLGRIAKMQDADPTRVYEPAFPVSSAPPRRT